MEILTERAQAFRQAITTFIDGRRDAKLKGDDNDGDIAAKYEYGTWLADAARRAVNLRVVTHPIKFTHSAIKGASSINYDVDDYFFHEEVGTHYLGDSVEKDFSISDAKHLDIYSLLMTEFEGRSLLYWVSIKDDDLMRAMHDDPSESERLYGEISQVFIAQDNLSSNILAKQIYWLVNDDPCENNSYQLLQPMFSSLLDGYVYASIRHGKDLFFLARGTKNQEPKYGDYYSYPDLVARKIGGSNAQNVSPLNKKRGGVNHLLSSLPPHWNTSDRIKVLNVDSVFHSFYFFDDVADLLKALSSLLLSDPGAVKATREKREVLAQALGQQLALYGESIRLSQEPGWSQHPDCRLPQCQRLWLDPERVELPPREQHQAEDEQFNAAYRWGDWPDEIAGYFANWLNARLHKAGLKTVSDVEYKHWAKQAIVDAHWPVPQQRRVPGGVA